MRVAFFEVQSWERELIEQSPLADRAESYEGCLNNKCASLVGGCDAISVFVYCPVDAETMDQMPGLKLITTRSTGTDHIDVAAAEQRGIAVANVPEYGANTVAEHTFGLILGLSRKIFLAHDRVRSDNFALEGLQGFDLKEKTLGVVGAGSIGLHVIRMARALSMEVLAYDVRESAILAEVLGFRYAALEEVFAGSDVISLHAPLVPATRRMVNRESLARMKRGVLIVNTARGELIDTEALVEALDSGQVGGAGLDVFEGEEAVKEESVLLHGDREPPSELRPLRSLLERDNVIITPHMGFYSREALRRILDTTIENILAFERGEPQNLVRG
ncbi:MAG: hydroxyacid dehydrogenase [Armatimonadota bacterium]|nr:MAG: hydroxyacid dehydrogenase [Armatimonadota bacterium]